MFSDHGCRETLPESDLLMHHVVFLGSAGQRGFGAGKADQVNMAILEYYLCVRKQQLGHVSWKEFCWIHRDGKVSVLRLRCEGYNQMETKYDTPNYTFDGIWISRWGTNHVVCVCVCVCVAGVVRVGSVQSLSYVRCFIGFTFAFEIDHVQKGWKVGGTVTRLALCNVWVIDVFSNKV